MPRASRGRPKNVLNSAQQTLPHASVSNHSQPSTSNLQAKDSTTRPSPESSVENLLTPPLPTTTVLFGTTTPLTPVTPLIHIPLQQPPPVGLSICQGSVATTIAASCDFCHPSPAPACPAVPCSAACIPAESSPTAPSGCRLCDLVAGRTMAEMAAAAVAPPPPPSPSVGNCGPVIVESEDPVAVDATSSHTTAPPPPPSPSVGNCGPVIVESEDPVAVDATSSRATESETAPSQKSLADPDPSPALDLSENEYSGPFSNPVYRKLSRINGEINKMSYSQLKERLSQLGMDSRGFKDVLKKRLKTFYKKQSLVQAKIPENYPLEAAGPVFCAGITLYSPLAHWGALKGNLRVGVVGIGGLGQMGVRLAAAMGNKVTAISSSPGKKDAALKLGASEFVVSTDEASMVAAAKSLDLILNTISASHQVSHYLPLLALNGTIVQLGIVGAPHQVVQGPLIFQRLSIAGSVIGGIAETQDCINFCAKHNVVISHEVIKADRLEEVYENLMNKNDSVKRYVLDCQSSATVCRCDANGPPITK